LWTRYPIINPNFLNSGGTVLTATGSNFAAVGEARMNVTQHKINSSINNNTFAPVNYPLQVCLNQIINHHFTHIMFFSQPCTIFSDVEMKCLTPRLQLPSSEEFGNFSTNFTLGFNLDDCCANQSEKDTRTTKYNISFTVYTPPTIKDHTTFWKPYDSSKAEPLELEVLQSCDRPPNFSFNFAGILGSTPATDNDCSRWH
jgi:hypothetical protein